MKTTSKLTSRLTVFVLAIALAVSAVFACFVFAEHNAAFADEEQRNIGRTYYYDELKNSDIAQKFYNLMGEIAEDGKFNDGIYEHDLSDMLTQAELKDCIGNSSSRIPVALAAARDAFFMDHPDLFYIDVYKLSLTYGFRDGNYYASLGTGRVDNYYTDYTVTSAAQAVTAEAAFKKAADDMAAAARSESADVVEQIRYVNNEIAENVVYDYGAYEDKHNNIEYNGYVNTAYGALVEKKALCGGYSQAFKSVMDRLGIPCVLIQGNAYSGDSAAGLQPGFYAHMWNAVQVDGLWYGVDTTWNASSVNNEKYLLVGDDFLAATHNPEGVVSSSGFELKYPVLRPFNYGMNKDASGFTIKDSGSIDGVDFGYSSSGNEENKTLTIGVSYEDKNCFELIEEGKYLAVRNANGDNKWTGWMCYPLFLKDNYEGGCVDKYMIYFVNGTVSKIQFAIMDYAASRDDFYVYPQDMDNSHIITKSIVYKVDTNGMYLPPPYPIHITPYQLGTVNKFDPVEISLEYSEELVYVEGKSKEDVGVTVTGQHDDVNKYLKIENLNWNEQTNTLSFVFTPSKQYSHDLETYYFVPKNLVGKRSGKVAEAAIMSYKMKEVVCPKVFNDGRLYIQTFGTPQFVGAEDMSLTEFKDKDGQPIVGNQRSQLMLVVNHPDADESKEMKDSLLADTELNLKESDIKASETYQINLTMCGLIQTVPKGSYMQVGFGFPDGIGPEDKDTTFTVYHYTRNADGTIDKVEAIPCVVTQYGIIATVRSFSPFMICAIDAAKAPSGKNIYSNVNGVGGTIDKTVISTVNTGESVSYVVTPDSGYKIDRLLLNGNDVSNKLDGNKITLEYSELENSNVLEVSFVSSRVQEYYDDKGVTVVQKDFIVTESDIFVAVAHGEDIVAPGSNGGANVGLIVGIVVAVAVVLIGGGLAIFLILRNQKKAKATDGGVVSESSRSARRNDGAKTNKATAATTDSKHAAATNKTPSRNNMTQSTSATRSSASNVPPRNGTAQRPQGTGAARPTATNTTQRPQSTGAARPTATNTAQRPQGTGAARPTATNTTQRPQSTGATRPGTVRRDADNKNKK